MYSQDQEGQVKYILVVFDGMADEPVGELDSKTPMQVAKKPFMDDLARRGCVGMAHTTPQGMQPGSDITNMNILGYDPREYYTGRAALEAASLQISLEPSDVAFRCNLVSTDGELMLESSADHIPTDDAQVLIELIDSRLSTRYIRFYPGVSYRHIMVWRDGSDDVNTRAPYKFIGKPFADYLPEGDGAEKLRQLIHRLL
jgi:2,3-bisphosphoglycerate-independent phosphoglycerate mutase